MHVGDDLHSVSTYLEMNTCTDCRVCLVIPTAAAHKLHPKCCSNFAQMCKNFQKSNGSSTGRKHRTGLSQQFPHCECKYLMESGIINKSFFSHVPLPQKQTQWKKQINNLPTLLSPAAEQDCEMCNATSKGFDLFLIFSFFLTYNI